MLFVIFGWNCAGECECECDAHSLCTYVQSLVYIRANGRGKGIMEGAMRHFLIKR